MMTLRNILFSINFELENLIYQTDIGRSLERFLVNKELHVILSGKMNRLLCTKGLRSYGEGDACDIVNSI